MTGRMLGQLVMYCKRQHIVLGMQVSMINLFPINKIYRSYDSTILKEIIVES